MKNKIFYVLFKGQVKTISGPSAAARKCYVASAVATSSNEHENSLKLTKNSLNEILSVCRTFRPSVVFVAFLSVCRLTLGRFTLWHLT